MNKFTALFQILIYLICIPQLHANSESSQLFGASIWINVPNDFHRSSDFVGIQSNDSYIEIRIAELPYSLNANLIFTAKNLFQKGLKILDQKKIAIGAFSGYLISASWIKENENEAFESLILGDDTESIIISTSSSKLSQSELKTRVSPILSSIRWIRPDQIELYNKLPFLVDGGSFFPHKKITGQSIIFSCSPKFSFENRINSMPFFGIGLSFSKADFFNKETFAKDKFREATGNFSGKIISSQKIFIDNLDGYEFIAEFKGQDSEIIVYQVTLFWDNNYVEMLGMAHLNEDKEKTLNIFKNIGKSFQRKKASLE